MDMVGELPSLLTYDLIGRSSDRRGSWVAGPLSCISRSARGPTIPPSHRAVHADVPALDVPIDAHPGGGDASPPQPASGRARGRRAARSRGRAPLRYAVITGERISGQRTRDPRGLPPRPGPVDRTRLHHHRLRGRARPTAQRTADQALPAPRRGRDAPFLRLRDPNGDALAVGPGSLPGGEDLARRLGAGVDPLGLRDVPRSLLRCRGRQSAPAGDRGGDLGGCCTRSCSTRPCTRSATSSTTAPTGSRCRCGASSICWTKARDRRPPGVAGARSSLRRPGELPERARETRARERGQHDRGARGDGRPDRVARGRAGALRGPPGGARPAGGSSR